MTPDTDRSTDHGWGPRLQVFLPDDTDPGTPAATTSILIDDRSPSTFRGWPTR